MKIYPYHFTFLNTPKDNEKAILPALIYVKSKGGFGIVLGWWHWGVMLSVLTNPEEIDQ